MASKSTGAGRRCVFCRMGTDLRFARLPMCGICHDQSFDFLWASGVQGALVATGLLGGWVFALEELLLFAVLVLVKHRVTHSRAVEEASGTGVRP